MTFTPRAEEEEKKSDLTLRKAAHFFFVVESDLVQEPSPLTPEEQVEVVVLQVQALEQLAP